MRNSRSPISRRPNIEQSYYDISDQQYLNHPLSPYPLAAWAQFTYEGVPVRVAEVVQSIKRVNGFGVVSEPLVVGPAVSIAINPKAGHRAFERQGLRCHHRNSQQRERAGERYRETRSAGRLEKFSRLSRV